jgi:hypothetical protein
VDENAKNDFQTGFRICPTFGEILPDDGGAIELVTDSQGKLTLLHFDGTKCLIQPQIQVGLTTYVAPFLDSSVLRAIRFPSGAAEYGKPGELFWKVVGLFRRYAGCSQDESVYLAWIVFCSWFACDPPITVCISAMGMRQIMRLVRLFHALCRRPLAVAELSRGLPLELGPTLLLNISQMSAKTAGFWRASNFSDVYVPRAGGVVSNIACGKIVFCETVESREAWGPEAMHLALLPTTEQLPSLTEQEAVQIADEYQPKFLLWRLHRLSSMHQSKTTSCPSNLGGQNLLVCVGEEPEIVKAVTLLLEAQEQELSARRSRNPYLAIVEAVWSAAHKKAKEISVAEVAQRVNVILHSRGENLQFSAHEIGWRLRHLELDRCHNGKAKVLRFSREICRRIHQLAAQFGLQLPKVAGCADCQGTQMVAQE